MPLFAKISGPKLVEKCCLEFAYLLITININITNFEINIK